MTTEEKKKELQTIIEKADEELTNVLMEAATDFQLASKEDFVVPKEWIDEAEERLVAYRNGTMSATPHEETMVLLRQHMEDFKAKKNQHV